MVMFIEKRWKKTKWLFLISFLLYLLFLILLSTFFGLMYFREGGKAPETLSFEDAARECKAIMQKIGMIFRYKMKYILGSSVLRRKLKRELRETESLKRPEIRLSSCWSQKSDEGSLKVIGNCPTTCYSEYDNYI